MDDLMHQQQSNGLKRLQMALGSARSSSKFCDIFFSVEGQLFELHQIVLSAYMEDYLNSHIRTGSQMDGSGSTVQNPIKLENFPGGASVFNNLIHYCYNEESFEINLQNAAALFYAADYFMMIEGEDSLSNFVCRYLEKQVKDHAFSPEDFANLYHATVVLERTHSLPHDFSKRCAVLLADYVSGGVDSVSTQLALQFSQIGTDLAPASFVEAMNESNKNDKSLTHFMAKVIHANAKDIPTDPPNKISEKKEVQRVFLNALNLSSLKLPEISSLIQLESELFIMVEDGKSGFINKYLSLEAKNFYKEFSTIQSITFGWRCFKVCKDELEDNEKTLKKPLHTIQSIVKMLLCRLSMMVGCSVECNPTTGLFEAIDNFDEELLKTLLELGADANIELEINMTPLIFAIEKTKKDAKYLQIVDLLLKGGADPNSDCHGNTPLHCAISDNFFETQLVSRLLDHGAHIEQENEDLFSPLNHACWIGNEAAIQYFINLGANPNSVSIFGGNALFSALSTERKDSPCSLNCIQQLITAGVDINTRMNVCQLSALDIAEMKGWGEIAAVLKGTGAQESSAEEKMVATLTNSALFDFK